MKYIKLVTLLFPMVLFAATPEWVRNYGTSKRYTDHVYLTGFGIATMDRETGKDACIETAVNNARRNLVEKIQVRVKSSVKTGVEERDLSVSEYFNSVVQATSDLEIQGLDQDTWFDNKNRTAYALAFVSRDKLVRLYNNHTNQIREEIIGLLDTGKGQEETGNPTEALMSYTACYPLMAQLVEAQAILTVAQTSRTQAFAELDGVVTQDRVSESQIREAISRLVQRPIVTSDDLAWYLAYTLSAQASLKDELLQVAPFTYQDTRMGSPFSRYFQQVLENKMIAIGGSQIAAGKEHDFILTGTYWEEAENMKFIASVRRVSDGRVVAGCDAVVDSAIINQTGRDIKPQNFAEAFSDQKAFGEDEVVGGGLLLEVWTDKGSENLIYTDGEPFQVYVRANVPSYIRFIYHLADGTRTLLLDNHYIDQTKVNKVYQIPEEFECAGPFGAEVLQVFGQTKPFQPAETVYQDGYYFLKNDLKKFLTQTRGIRRKKKKKLMQTEKRLVVTTMAE